MGLSEAIPNVYSGKEWFKNADGQYVYVWAQPELLSGVQTFKKFYDAGFLKKEFFNDADYEARDQFSAGQLFSYWDGLGMDFYNNVCNRYVSANPEAVVEEAIACAWLKLDSGNLLINQSGNTWSEIVFSPDVSDEQLTAILGIYDYLLSPEGVRFNNFGIKGKDYDLDEEGNVLDLREKNPETGVVLPFNADAEVPDYAPVVLTGALADSAVLSVSPVIRQYCKDEYQRLMNLRKDDSAVHLMAHDDDVATFAGEIFLTAGAGLRPVDAVYKIIFENAAEDVPAAWQNWLDENQATIDSISAEVNAALGNS